MQIYCAIINMYVYSERSTEMSFNSETFSLMLKFGGAMIGLLLLVWLVAVGTPYAAKFIDKTLGKAKIDQGDKAVPDPERVQDDENKNDDAPSEYRVYDIYEGTPSDGKNENTDKKD